MWSTFEDFPPFSRAGASPLGTEDDVDDEVEEVDKDEDDDRKHVFFSGEIRQEKPGDCGGIRTSKRTKKK